MSVYLASIDNIKANDKFGIIETTIMCAKPGTGPVFGLIPPSPSNIIALTTRICSQSVQRRPIVIDDCNSDNEKGGHRNQLKMFYFDFVSTKYKF